MMVGVLFTLGRTGFTNTGTKFTNLRSQGAIGSHKGYGSLANEGAGPIQANALHQHLNVGFHQTGIGAMVTGNGAGLAGFDAA